MRVFSTPKRRPVLREARPVLRVWIVFAFIALPALASAQEFNEATRLRELSTIRSMNGVLNATLDASPQKVDLGSVSFDGLTYNGDYAGPLLQVQPGDVMHIKLINHLSDPTNLHYHGTHTSPLINGDNVYLRVNPGETFEYEVRIPLTQPPGLYWYHPHIHGISERMVNAGLSGALLVDGLAQQIPELAHVKAQIMIAKQYEAEKASDPELKRLHKLVQTINGQLFSSIAMHKSETQLWEIVNPGPNYFFHLSVKNHKFRIIGWDGVSASRETVVDRLDIGPATRVAALVDAGEQPGRFELVSEQTPTGLGAEQTDSRILGMVVVDDASAVPAVTEIKTFPARADLSKSKIDAYRTFVFSEDASKDEYYINNRRFDHDRIDTRVPLGNTEQWTLHNNSDDLHVFHIHQMHFQVLKVNEELQSFNGYLDTVRIPERGSVTLIMPFTDPAMIGKFVYHCHVLQHEDNGMMANIEVYDPASENMLLTLWRRFFPEVQYAGQICGASTKSMWWKIKSLLSAVL